MKTLRKALFILLIANIIRIVPGCCDCDLSSVPFDFNKTDIVNIDNSGEWAVTTQLDTMLPGAVAFEISLFDSLGYYNQYASNPERNNFGYSSACALSCDCSYPMVAGQYLKTIGITTMYDMNEEIDAGDDVTDFFVGKFRGNSSSGSSVYLNLENICSQTENKTYFDGGVESFGIFLKPEVENQEARFITAFTFSDNRVLTDTTNLIHILH